MPCGLCGGTYDTAWSDEAGAWMCERCYCRLPSSLERKPIGPVVHLPAPRRPKRSDYERFVETVWTKLETRTGRAVHYMGPGKVAGYCPVCGDGTLSVTFVNLTSGPRVKCRCSLGCTARLVAEALQ